MNDIKWYLAGPMTGIPQFNYPLFDSVSAELRASGYDITSPAEMDDGCQSGGHLAGSLIALIGIPAEHFRHDGVQRRRHVPAQGV